MRPFLPVSYTHLIGRTALVTGASGGIGAGIARRFAEAGAGVVCHYRRNREAADRLVDTIVKAGGRAVALQANLADSVGATRLVEEAVRKFGTLDILINNAGLQESKPMAEIDEGDWTAMMTANVAAPFFLIAALAEHLRSIGKGGAVVNISSIEGYHPAPGHGHYATAKAALRMLTRAAAVEFAPLGLRVNCVCPGLIHREGIETGWPEGVQRWMKAAALKRLGSPEDVADACLFLASDAARWITGADLKVDGGVTAGSPW